MKLIAHKMNTIRLDALPLINAASLFLLPYRQTMPAASEPLTIRTA
jgi:hypothetical protein